MDEHLVRTKSRYLQSPYLEIIIMVSSILLSFFGLAVLSMVPGIPAEGVMPTSSISLITVAFFLLSIAIAMISVIAGIGGGVIFTPLMLAFTNVNSLVVRGTGLIVAMFSGLISTGIFIKKGLGNYKLFMTLTLSQGIGAFLGATLAVSMARNAGAAGEGFMRAGLGVILALIAAYMFLGGKKAEWPVIKKVGRFTAWLRLDGSYYEEAENRIREYRVTRAALGISLLFVVGMVGGFFGMGGGWAITPSLNLGMGLPLKLAAANSGMILGIGSCVSIWPYIKAGSIIPMFVLPWLSGQVIGGFIGSYALARIKVKVVRLILIGIMVFTAFGLLAKGLNLIGLIGTISALVQVIVFLIVFVCVIISVIFNGNKRNDKDREKTESTNGKTMIIQRSLIPASHHIYAGIVHWVTLTISIAALFLPLFILIDPSKNILDPNLVFSAVFNGASPREIWGAAASANISGFGLFIKNITMTDSWAMLAVCTGCAVGLIAVVPAVVVQFFRERDIQNGCLGIMTAALMFCAVTGII